MNKATAIKAITKIINGIDEPIGSDSITFHSKYRRNDKIATYTIASIDKPRLTVNAIHFNGAKKRMQYHDWKNKDMKLVTKINYKNMKPYANETQLELRLYNKKHPKPFTATAYSLPQYSDLRDENDNRIPLVNYIYKHFNAGDVIKAKLVMFNLNWHITWIDKIKD